MTRDGWLLDFAWFVSVWCCCAAPGCMLCACSVSASRRERPPGRTAVTGSSRCAAWYLRHDQQSVLHLGLEPPAPTQSLLCIWYPPQDQQSVLTWGWNLHHQCNRCSAHRMNICKPSCSSAAPFKHHTLLVWYPVSMPIAPEVFVAAAQQLCCTSPLLQSVCRRNTHCCCHTLFSNVTLCFQMCNRRGAPTSALICAVRGVPPERWTSTHRRSRRTSRPSGKSILLLP
jgi:hypothetical protein